MFDINIIIVSWNAKGHLINCLNSLSNPRGFTQEIIVIDNGSSDGSVEIIENQFPQVKLIKNNDNLGFAKANNIGIRASTGRYVCLINSDVIVLDGGIEKLIEFMDKNPLVGMSGPRTLNQNYTLQHSCFHFPSIWNNFCQVFGLNKLFPKSKFFSGPIMKYWPHDCERRVDMLNGCFWLVRRIALNEVGLLDEDFFFYGEDVDWCKRFHEAAWDVMFYPQAEIIHIGGGSSINSPIMFFLEMQRADLHYWRKHHGKLGQSAYWVIILLRQLVRLPVYVLIYILRPSAQSNSVFKMKQNLVCIQWLFKYQKNKE
jgi:GT2 family glycosyltransferase